MVERIERLEPELRRRAVAKLDVLDERQVEVVRVVDANGVEPERKLRLGDADFAERLQQYLDLGDALRERVSAIDYVDLRFPERLYVRPAKGSSVAPASSRTGRR